MQHLRTMLRHRDLRGRLRFQRSLFQLQLLLLGEGGRDVAAPLLLQINGVLLVDMLLLVRRRVRTRDVKAAVLHEVVIGVAAARLAASGELRTALGQRRRLLFGGGRLVGGLGAFLEIGGRTVPPLRGSTRQLQHHYTCEAGHKKRGDTRKSHRHYSPAKCAATIATNCYHFAAGWYPRKKQFYFHEFWRFFLTKPVNSGAPGRSPESQPAWGVTGGRVR